MKRINIILQLVALFIAPSAHAIWLSVDPLADKYPNISPYAYCTWNPVNRVDPDGMDVWELDESGNIVNKIMDKNQDAFRMNGKELSFAYGSVTESHQDSKQTTFAFGNEDVAANVFKFMADNSAIEYGLINSESGSTIVTQHGASKVNFGIALNIAENENTITSIFHNHPGNSGPSGFGNKKGDRQALHKLENDLGYKIAAFVYLPKTSSVWLFSEADSNVGIFDFNMYFPNVGTQYNRSPSLFYRIKHSLGIYQ